MNNWSFTGHIGGDCNTRFTQSGDPIVSFSVGVKSGFGEKATTTWANCAMFGKRGEAVAQYLKKGAQVGITGEVSLREWQDKEGQKRVNLDVRVNDLTLLGSKDRQESAPQSQSKPAKAKPSQDDYDDIPF